MRPAVENAAGRVLPHAAPLLEEERNVRRPALIPKGKDPLFIHRSRTVTTLSAYDHPIDSSKIEMPEVLEKRFNGEEPDGRRCPPESFDSRQAVAPILDADPEPHVGQPGQPGELAREQLAEPLMPLREHLERMPRGLLHDPANGRDVLGRHSLLEQVAHGVDEYAPWRPPAERIPELVGDEPEVEALLEGMAGHASEALREGLGVAVLAARTDLHAAADGVPGGVGPLDGAAVTHGSRALGADRIEARCPGMNDMLSLSARNRITQHMVGAR